LGAQKRLQRRSRRPRQLEFGADLINVGQEKPPPPPTDEEDVVDVGAAEEEGGGGEAI
jgi:hypothetical protein